ncbi:MAG: hypothetical protein AAFQ02_11425 [Bacteroidota bacterium]
MTLQELFDAVSTRPEIICFYFLALPLTALLASIFGKAEGHLTPWKEMYCVLIYLACIPGIFAVILNVYLFLFERQSVMDTNVFTQILPIVVMVLTLWLIRRNVAFDHIPGFDRLGGLLMIVFAVLAVMWLLDRMRIVAITFLPFQYVLLLLVAALIGIRFGLKKVMA